MSSTHQVKVVPITNLEKHPNADSLVILRIDDGYQVVLREADWKGIDKAAHVLPDNIVDVTRSEFAWLRRGTETTQKTKAIRLRGELSYGFLVPVPDDFKIGDDVTEFLGVKPYEPELHYSTGGNTVSPPGCFHGLGKYDLENYRKYSRMIAFEPVILSEKLNGGNIRVVMHDGQLYVGSRNEWKSPDNEDSLFWNVVHNTPELVKFCERFPNTLVYGEVYGMVKGWRYDGNGHPKFRCFDILQRDGKFVDADKLFDICDKYQVPTVPVLPFEGILSFEEITMLAEGDSMIGDHMKEGIVITPKREVINHKLGRLKLKCVSNQYLEK